MTVLRHRPTVEVRNAAGSLLLRSFPASQEQLDDLERWAEEEGNVCTVAWPKGNHGSPLTHKQRVGGDMIFARNRKSK